MSDEDSLQMKKNALWEVHTTNSKIECLKHKIELEMEACQRAHEAWKNGCLSAWSGRLVSRRGEHQASTELPQFSSSRDIASLVAELEDAVAKGAKLQAAFDRLCS